MGDFIIEVRGLKKSFKGQAALDGLDLSVPAGSIFGFLGRNGAGKTTTIKILMSLLRQDAGFASIFGSPARNAIEARRRVGFVTEDKELYPYMTVEQIIRFTRPFFPKWRADLERRYLEMFELPRRKKIPDLSKGMRSKLMLLIAMSHEAELLILDEPTEGLDPVGVEDILRELVSLAAKDGTTVFFSSHQLEEVEQIADQIAIIDHGRAVVSGSLDDLKQRYKRLNIVLQQEMPAAVPWLDGAERVRQQGRTISFLAGRNVGALIEQAQSLPGSHVELFPVSLKDIFLEHVRGN
ncbi:MAG TPA: ABC transporter ATP-binding protein [Bryobacteraceae bacterium]|nr:ABC transporter ATP-binding protein [Bryobacteraceae bacterium]